jgi:hypothetical protein
MSNDERWARWGEPMIGGSSFAIPSFVIPGILW